MSIKERRVPTFEEQKAFVADLNLVEDLFFRYVLQDRAAAEEVVRVLLGSPDLKVVECRTQEDLPNPIAREAVLDLYCVDAQGRAIDVEMQNADEKDCLKRTRFIRSALTVGRTGKGTPFGRIRDVCTVFIATFDPFGLGRTTYEVERRLKDDGPPVPNGEREIYVSTVNDDGSPVARLMRYFVSSTAEGDAMFPVLSERVRNCKEDAQEVPRMWGVMEKHLHDAREEGRAEGREEGRVEGREEGLLASLRNLMANLGCTIEKAMDLMGVQPEERKRLLPLLG